MSLCFQWRLMLNRSNSISITRFGHFLSFLSHRKDPKWRPTGPLVIPALENRDWRAAARKRRAVGTFVPESAKAITGADGSVGGLGTRDTVNSGPQSVGLVVKAQSKQAVAELEDEDQPDSQEDVPMESEKPPEELTEDERALRAILQGDLAEATTQIEIIPPSKSRTETDAYREDVVTLPDNPTLADYERVPIDQFGAALMRGMGWKEGMAASRTRKGPVQPYLPETRPALLGIGAKERPAEDIPGGSSRKDGKKFVKPDKKYVPLVMKSKERGAEDDKVRLSLQLRYLLVSQFNPYLFSDMNRLHRCHVRRPLLDGLRVLLLVAPNMRVVIAITIARDLHPVAIPKDPMIVGVIPIENVIGTANEVETSTAIVREERTEIVTGNIGTGIGVVILTEVTVDNPRETDSRNVLDIHPRHRVWNIVSLP